MRGLHWWYRIRWSHAILDRITNYMNSSLAAVTSVDVCKHGAVLQGPVQVPSGSPSVLVHGRRRPCYGRCLVHEYIRTLHGSCAWTGNTSDANPPISWQHPSNRGYSTVLFISLGSSPGQWKAIACMRVARIEQTWERPLYGVQVARFRWRRVLGVASACLPSSVHAMPVYVTPAILGGATSARVHERILTSAFRSVPRRCYRRARRALHVQQSFQYPDASILLRTIFRGPGLVRPDRTLIVLEKLTNCSQCAWESFVGGRCR